MTTTVDTNYKQLGSLGKARLNQVVSEARKIINDAVATRQLLSTESGAICCFDSAAGVVYTLPPITADNIGMFFDFRTTVTITSNAAKVITKSTTTEFIIGVVQLAIVAAATTLAAAFNGTSHVAISSNGTTTGGVIGDQYRLTAISTTQWLIEGVLSGSGSIATPAATS